MTRRSCLVPAVGIVSALLLVVGIGLVVSQVFRNLMHNRLKKVRKVTLKSSWLFFFFFLKHHNDSVALPVYRVCPDIAVITLFAHLVINLLSLLLGSFIKPGEI